MAEIKFYQDPQKTVQVYPAIDPDGNYPGVVVGLADNLINNEGISQTGSWNLRTTGGNTHISEGWAELKKMKGACSTSTIPEALHINIGHNNTGVLAATCNVATFRTAAAQTSTEQETYNFIYSPYLTYQDGRDLIYRINESVFSRAAFEGSSEPALTKTFVYDGTPEVIDDNNVVASFNKHTFLTAVDNHMAAYHFTYDGTKWMNHDIEIDLSLFGITTTGEEIEDTEIVIYYYENNWYDENTIVNMSDFGITTTKEEVVGDIIEIDVDRGHWYLGESLVLNLSDYGITITEGAAAFDDLIQIVYQPEVVGHVRVAHPTGIYTIGMNQFNVDDVNMIFDKHNIDTNGNIIADADSYVVFFRCIGGNTYTIYDRIANSVSKVCYYAEEPSTSTTGMTILSTVTNAVPANKAVVNSAIVKHYTPSANGYLVIATSDIEDLCCHLTWTGSADTVYESYWNHLLEIRYEDEYGTIISSYGLPAIDSTYYDEIDFERYEYYRRVERVENTPENMAMVQGLSVPYIYDTDYIYYGRETEIFHLSKDENYDYKVSDYGIEEVINHQNTLALPVEMTILYETNLKSKLKNGVEVLENKVTEINSLSTDNQYPSAEATWELDQALRHIIGMDVDTFSTTKTYAVNDYVIHDLKLYICTTAVETAGAWNASNWTESYLFNSNMGINGSINIFTGSDNNKTTLQNLVGKSADLGNDLNSYVETGIYYFPTDNTDLHHPSAGLAGWLIVLNQYHSRVKQIWTRYTGGIGCAQTYMRVGTTVKSATESWSDWVRLLDQNDYNSLFYQAGDTTEIKEWYSGATCIGGGTKFDFTIPLDKRMASGVNARITGGRINIQQNGSYIVNDLNLPDSKVTLPYSNRPGYLTFAVEYSTAIGTQAVPAAVMVDNLTLEFY